MKKLLEMVEVGGWFVTIKPNHPHYTHYTVVFSSPGSEDLTGHGKTVKKAVKKAIKGLR